jgi:hypothetical protein
VETKKVTPQALVQAGATGATLALADGAAATPSLTNTGDENTGIFFPAADTIAFSEGGVESMRIDSSGNLGIGTSSPANYANYRNLAISGTTGGNIDMLSGSTKVGNLFNDGTNFYAYNAIAGSLVFGTNSTERMRLDSSGNLGIGTASPGSYGKFVVVGTGDVGNFDTSSGATGLAFFENGSGRARIRTLNGSNGLAFLSGASEAMRIDANLNVVAGASSALATTATNGFLYVPTCAGTPTGTPTAITGMAPIVVNTTNNKLYFYSGGAWRDAGP